MKTFEEIQKEKILGVYWNSENIVKSETSNELSESPKFKKVMDEWKNGTLYSSNGDRVTSQSQAIAIAYSESENVKKSHDAESTKQNTNDFVGGKQLKEYQKDQTTESAKNPDEEGSHNVVKGEDFEILNEPFSDLCKSLDFDIEKGKKAVVGETRTHGGVKKVKQSDGTWKEVKKDNASYDKEKFSHSLENYEKLATEIRKLDLDVDVISTKGLFNVNISKKNITNQKVHKINDLLEKKGLNPKLTTFSDTVTLSFNGGSEKSKKEHEDKKSKLKKIESKLGSNLNVFHGKDEIDANDLEVGSTSFNGKTNYHLKPKKEGRYAYGGHEVDISGTPLAEKYGVDKMKLHDRDMSLEK